MIHVYPTEMREQFMVDVFDTGAAIVRDDFAKGARDAWTQKPCLSFRRNDPGNRFANCRAGMSISPTGLIDVDIDAKSPGREKCRLTHNGNRSP